MECNVMEHIKANACCGSCLKPVRSSTALNMMSLDKCAEWEFPTRENVTVQGDVKHAVAVLCDECIDKKKKSRYALELRDGHSLIMHKVETLDDIPQYVRDEYERRAAMGQN